MESSDLTIEILRSIRDEVKTTNGRLEETNGRLDALRVELRGELGALREETTTRLEDVSRRIVESEVRTATAIVDLRGTMQEVVAVLRERSDDLRPRVERCEQEIDELKRAAVR